MAPAREDAGSLRAHTQRNGKMRILNVYFKTLVNRHKEGLFFVFIFAFLFLLWSYDALSLSCQKWRLSTQRKG